jgi:hypothetical protein
MAELTPEQEEFVRQARKLAEERAGLTPEDRVPMANPDKFADPIGMDDEGNLFPPDADEHAPESSR